MEINYQLVIDNTRRTCVFLQYTYEYTIFTRIVLSTREEHYQACQNIFLFASLIDLKNVRLFFSVNLFLLLKIVNFVDVI